ncbi:MAG: hypothetical protein ABSA39_17580 [Edaphobacter sp.]
MAISVPAAGNSGSGNVETPANAFRLAFIAKCHRLLALGYNSLDSKTLNSAEETVITGLLVQAINGLIEDENAPSWMEPFIANDDPPQNTPGRLGKRRRRIDIEMVQMQKGARPRFLFEAKRLGRRAALKAYLGQDGLNLYARGEYAREQVHAGMLGYIQTGDPASWAEQVRSALASDPKKHSVEGDGGLIPHSVVTELAFTYRSRHTRAAIGLPITVIHTFLSFC